MNTKNKISLLIISACQLFSLSAFAQTANVQKKISDNTLTGPIVVPSGGSFTIGAGATITNNGTATGFSSSLAVGTSAVTGGTSGYLLYNNAGTLGNIATAVGGANTADSGKVPVFSSNGNLRAYFYRAVASDNTQYTDYYPFGNFAATNHLGGGFTLSVARLSAVTADRILQWPDASGFLVSTGDTGTVTNTMLATSAITIAGTSTALGGSITFDAMVPSQTGNSGKYLTTNGSTTSWGTVSTGLTIGTTAIASGAAGRLLYETGGNKVGEISGATSDGTTLTLVAPVLGTPASGTLTNCTGLPASGVVGTAAILGANTFTATQTFTLASANTGLFSSTGYSLTGSSTTSLQNIAGTLNTSGSPEVVKWAFTDTASGSSTKYFMVKVGASGTTDGFGLIKNTAVTGAVSFIIGGGTSSRALSIGASDSVTMKFATDDGVSSFLELNGNAGASSGSRSVYLPTETLGICSKAHADVFLQRDAAGILALKNSTTAQAFRVYGTTTGSKYTSVEHNGTNMVITDSNSGAIWRTGAGTPEGSITAPVGSLYTRTDGGAGTTLYVKESGSGNTGWVAK